MVIFSIAMKWTGKRLDGVGVNSDAQSPLFIAGAAAAAAAQLTDESNDSRLPVNSRRQVYQLRVALNTVFCTHSNDSIRTCRNYRKRLFHPQKITTTELHRLLRVL